MNRQIHLIWLGDDAAGNGAAAVAHWREHAPGREVTLHTESSLLLPEFRAIYDKLSLPQMKSDLLRWSILLSVGGWYFDCDVRTQVGIEQIEADTNPSDEVCLTATLGNSPSGIWVGVLCAQPAWPAAVALRELVLQRAAGVLPYGAFGGALAMELFARGPQWFRQAPPDRYSLAADQGTAILRHPRPSNRQAAQAVQSSPRGPGTCLHDAIMRWTGEFPTGTCNCHKRIQRMNQWGPVTCRLKIKRIVGWLQSEAKKRNWVLRFGVAVPGAQFAIRRMVLNAIEESERDHARQEGKAHDRTRTAGNRPLV